MSEFKLKVMVLGMVQTNCYIISNEALKEAIVIDPADNADKIEEYLKSNDLVCKGILLTHGHFDHIMAAKEMALNAGAKIYAHEAEVGLLEDGNLNASYNFMNKDFCLTPDVLLKDSDRLELIDLTFQVIHTPGHTAGGVCYYLEETLGPVSSNLKGKGTLFSGDTLFRESIGRTDLPTGNGGQLLASIKNKLMPLEDGVVVYPGHGGPTSIGYERSNNIFLTDSWESDY